MTNSLQQTSIWWSKISWFTCVGNDHTCISISWRPTTRTYSSICTFIVQVYLLSSNYIKELLPLSLVQFEFYLYSRSLVAHRIRCLMSSLEVSPGFESPWSLTIICALVSLDFIVLVLILVACWGLVDLYGHFYTDSSFTYHTNGGLPSCSCA